MGLKLKLKPNERVFVSGALIRNAGSGAVLELMNNVPMLREKDILLEQDAKSPCQQLYLIVQTLYFDPASRHVLLQSFNRLLGEVLQAAPSLRASLEPLAPKLADAQYYSALKDLQVAITHESELISHAE
jgi:flagellar protein FlbT